MPKKIKPALKLRLNAVEHTEARRVIQSVWDAADRKVDPWPAFKDLTEDAYNLLMYDHSLVVGHASHLDDKLRHFTNAIQPRPGETVPLEEPRKEPDPLTPETAALAVELERRQAAGLPLFDASPETK